MERRDARAAHGRVLRGPRALGLRARVRARLRRPAGRVGRGAAAAPSARRRGRRPLGAPQDGGGSRPRRLRGARPGQRPGARRCSSCETGRCAPPIARLLSRGTGAVPPRARWFASPASASSARRRRRRSRSRRSASTLRGGSSCSPASCGSSSPSRATSRASAAAGQPRPAPASRRRRDDERGGSRTALHHEARPPRRRLRAALPDLTPGAGCRLASAPAPGLAGRLPRRALRAQLRPRERSLLLRRLRARVHGVLRRAGLRAAAGERAAPR